MSKIGKIAISIPDKVKVAINGGILNIDGPKGKTSLNIDTDIFDLDITVMTNGCKNFIETWNMVNKQKNGNIVLNASQSDDFIHRFCSKLSVSPEILNLCIRISKKAEEFSIVSENTPPSIAAGSIYLACQLTNINISKKDISDVCKISEVTISKCYKKLFKYKEHLVS